MFLDINSIVINGVKIAPYITQAKFNYNKLWGEDSGRNLAGTMIASLVGIFPKIELEFKPLNRSEIETIVPILDSSSQTVSYFDPYKKRQISIKTYTGDYHLDYTNNRKCKGFSCSFIALRKRG